MVISIEYSPGMVCGFGGERLEFRETPVKAVPLAARDTSDHAWYGIVTLHHNTVGIKVLFLSSSHIRRDPRTHFLSLSLYRIHAPVFKSCHGMDPVHGPDRSRPRLVASSSAAPQNAPRICS